MAEEMLYFIVDLLLFSKCLHVHAFLAIQN